MSTDRTQFAIFLVATRPSAYGTYTTTAIVTATASSGDQIGPVTTQVGISYLGVLYIYRFPLIFKQSP